MGYSIPDQIRMELARVEKDIAKLLLENPLQMYRIEPLEWKRHHLEAWVSRYEQRKALNGQT